MKKLYTVALAAACVFGASAAERQAAVAEIKAQPTASYVKALKVNTPAKATVKALDTNAAFTGLYDYSCEFLLNGGSAPTELEITITNPETGEGTIAGLFDELDPIKVIVDAAAGTLSIPNNQYLGEDKYGKEYFYVKGVVEENGELKVAPGAADVKASVGTVDGNTITFDTYSIWAVGNPDTEDDGFHYLSFANVMTLFVEEGDPNEGWTAIGKGKLYDGWICTAFGSQQEWEVDMQQSDADPNVLRIVNPYRQEGFPYLARNQYRRNGYIEFNISDASNIIFNAVGAGFGNSSMGISNVYCSNDVSSLLGSLGMTIDDMDLVIELAASSGYEIKYTTLADGIVNLPEGGVFFGDTEDPYAGYGWQDKAGNLVDMSSRITLPSDFTAGISNVVADSNAPVEFFNLQGLRVQNPEAGQILIRRQGEKVSKIIVK